MKVLPQSCPSYLLCYVSLGINFILLYSSQLVGLLGKTCHHELFDHFMDRATTIFKKIAASSFKDQSQVGPP
jgi:hypothetical protein